MDVDLSLDEIIKKKGIGAAPASKKIATKRASPKFTGNGIGFKKFSPFSVMDARSKIIKKNRAKIRDARDKLVEITRFNGDARNRIGARSHKDAFTMRGLTTASFRNGRVRNSMRPYSGVSGLSNIIEIPRGYVDYDNMDHMEEEEFISGQLSRTVKNDLLPFDSCAPPAPRRLDSWSSESYGKDPFEVYEVEHSRLDRTDLRIASEPHSLRRQVSRKMSPDMLRSNLRHRSPPSSPTSYSRRYLSDRSSHLSYEMRTRLQQAPDPHASMGIFANPISKHQSSSSSNSGYRIVVSNLHTSVTQNDIKELFEDIGELYESRIVRPGVAEVIYKNLKDADKAVDTYHNRQLDGQPMKCLLVNPRSSTKPTASAIKSGANNSSNSRLSSGKAPLEIDIDALHKVLFRRHVPTENTSKPTILFSK